MKRLDPEYLKLYATDMLARDPLPGSDGLRAQDVKQDIDAWLKPVLQDLSAGEYLPQPYLRFWMKLGAKKRPIDCPALIDRVLMSACNSFLIPTLKPQPSVYGIANKGWQALIAQLEERLSKTPKVYALSFDINRFFESIDHSRLLALLEERLPMQLVKLYELWLSNMSIAGDRIIPNRSQKGLAQGASISPYLAQLYMEEFDQWIHEQYPNMTHYRYLDDCLALASSKKELEKLKLKLVRKLSDFGLTLNLKKLELAPLASGKLSYLGHTFTQTQAHHSPVDKLPVTIIGSTKAQLTTELARYAIKRLDINDDLWETGHDQGLSVKQLFALEVDRAGKTAQWYQNASLSRPLRTVYLINTPAKVRIDRGALRIELFNQAPKEIPLSHIGQIVALGPVELTSSAIRYCLSEDIPVLFLSQTGSYFGRLDSAKRHREPMLERQFRLKDHPQKCLSLAKSFIQGRLHNARILLSRNNRKPHRQSQQVQQAINALKLAQKELKKAQSLDEIRGIEGRASAQYWQGFAALLPAQALHKGPVAERPFESDTWGFKGRNRRPPLDPVNSLISLVAVLLTYNIYSIIELSGLTPYAGVLHSGKRRAPALAFDLIEEFRAPLVESIALSLIGKHIMSIEDFEWRDTALGPGVFVRRSALPKVIKMFESKLSQEREHPSFGLRGDMRRMMHLQVLHFATCLDRDEQYEPFMIR